MRRRLLRVLPEGVDLAKASALLNHVFANPFLQLGPSCQPDAVQVRRWPSLRILLIGKTAFRAMVALALWDGMEQSSGLAVSSSRVAAYCSHIAMAVTCVRRQLHTCLYLDGEVRDLCLREAIDSFHHLVGSLEEVGDPWPYLI